MSTSRIERKAYHSSHTSSSRTMSPLHNTRSQYDNSLDNLLDDLQSTVSRPLTNGSTNVYKDTLVEKSSSRSPNLIKTTPVTDYTVNDTYSYTAPDGSQHYKSVKSEQYHYNRKGGLDFPPEKLRMQDNINQLDSLLDDLQHAKGADNIMGTNTNNNNIHQEFYKSNTSTGRSVVERAVPHYDEQSQSRSLERREDRVQKYQQDAGSYGDIKSLRTRTPSPTFSKKVNVQTYPVEIVESTSPDINPEILAELDPNLLPSGNTKVTTTIKTYTYEIPGHADPEEYVQKALHQSINQYEHSQTSNQSITTPSKSFVYSPKNYEESESSNRSARIAPRSPQSEHKIVKESITTRNYQPDNKVYTDVDGKRTYIYNETVKSRDYKDYTSGGHPVEAIAVRPSSRSSSRPQTPRNDMYHTTYHTETTTRSSSGIPHDGSPDRTSLPPVTTTIHKFDSMNNLNARQYPDVETFDPKFNPASPNSVQLHPEQPDVNITYKYRSTTNTTNRYNTERYDNEPIMPRKFPTDDTEGPPKRLDDLMAQIGNEPPTSSYNAGWSAHEREVEEQRKVDSLKASQDYEKRKRDELPLSKNITGAPVYYPPDHETHAHKEEAAAWKAEGAMAKEKGKYKYEAESRSKSKSSSGATLVPVCLPLCCGLPCTII